jgi:hypothetical protein
VEGFYFKQVTGDSGEGATLGSFEGMTAGVGPVLGYILPIGKQSLSFEVKWLTDRRNWRVAIDSMCARF